MSAAPLLSGSCNSPSSLCLCSLLFGVFSSPPFPQRRLFPKLLWMASLCSCDCADGLLSPEPQLLSSPRCYFQAPGCFRPEERPLLKEPHSKMLNVSANEMISGGDKCNKENKLMSRECLSGWERGFLLGGDIWAQALVINRSQGMLGSGGRARQGNSRGLGPIRNGLSIPCWAPFPGWLSDTSHLIASNLVSLSLTLPCQWLISLFS